MQVGNMEEARQQVAEAIRALGWARAEAAVMQVAQEMLQDVEQTIMVAGRIPTTTTLSEQNYTLSRTTLPGGELHFEQNYTQNSIFKNSRVLTYHNK